MKRYFIIFTLIFLTASFSSYGACAIKANSSKQKPMLIGVKKQLLVDDYIIEKTINITRELGTVTKVNNGNPVLVADKPWEDADIFRMGSVIHDGSKFRMWYGAAADIIAYAESEDGINWTKPNLGQIEYKGSKENNIVDPRGQTCLFDPHETDPDHRYKSVYGVTVKATIAHSPDGFNWISYNDGKPVTGRAADTTNQVFWDEESKVYRLFTRTDYGRGLYGGTLNENRGTRDMVNPDIKSDPTNWKTVREWKFDKEGPWEFKRRQVYALTGWRYEGILFGLLFSYEWAGVLGEGHYDLVKRHEMDILNYYIVTARGNEMWDLKWVYDEKPIVPRGPDGSFDKDWIQPSPNIVTWNDKHWLYYGGAKERHDIYRVRDGGQTRWQCSVGAATLRLDGFVGLTAKEKLGEVVTKTFKLDGDHLEINVDATKGSVQVEVLSAEGRPTPGFSSADAVIYRGVDNIRLRPTWSKTLSSLKGKEIKLRFRMSNAALYAFQIKDN